MERAAALALAPGRRIERFDDGTFAIVHDIGPSAWKLFVDDREQDGWLHLRAPLVPAAEKDASFWSLLRRNLDLPVVSYAVDARGMLSLRGDYPDTTFDGAEFVLFVQLSLAALEAAVGSWSLSSQPGGE